MLRSELTGLREERAAIFESLKKINDAAEAAERDLTAEEATEYRRLDAEFERLSKRIERGEVELDREARLGRDRPADGRLAGILGATRADSHEDDAAEVESRAFTAFLRARGDLSALDAELRAPLQVSPSAQGGYTIPAAWATKLIEAARQFGVIEQLADAIDTDGGGDLHLPVVVDPSTLSASQVAESGAYTETEDTFSEVILRAYKYGTLSKASDEMVNDSLFDIASFVLDRSAQAIALAINPKLVNGTGTNEPRGILNNTIGVTLPTGNTTSITSDGLFDLYHSVPVPYRANASWILHDTTLKFVRKLKDTTGQYLWQPGLQAGQPDLLLGRPVFIDPDFPQPAANAKTVLFGDVKRNYVVRRAGAPTLKVLNERYADLGQVGFRVDRRIDGNIQDAAAARLLVQSAT